MVAPAGAASHARTSGERTAIGRRSRTQLIAIGSRAGLPSRFAARWRWTKHKYSRCSNESGE